MDAAGEEAVHTMQLSLSECSSLPLWKLWSTGRTQSAMCAEQQVLVTKPKAPICTKGETHLGSVAQPYDMSVTGWGATSSKGLRPAEKRQAFQLGKPGIVICIKPIKADWNTFQHLHHQAV